MQDQNQEQPQPQIAIPEVKDKEEKVQVPLALIRWLLYAVMFGVLLLPFVIQYALTVWQYVSASLVLAHFSGQLNKIIDK